MEVQRRVRGLWLPPSCWKYTKFIIYCDKIGQKMLVTFETMYNEVGLVEHTCDRRDFLWSEKINKYSIWKDMMRHASSKSKFNLQNFSTLLLFQYKYTLYVSAGLNLKWNLGTCQGCRVRAECPQYVKYNIIHKI